MWLKVVMEVRVDDPVAVGAYLLGPAPSTDGLALPPPAPIEEQAAQVLRETIHEHLTSTTEHTGIAVESLRVSLAG